MALFLEVVARTLRRTLRLRGTLLFFFSELRSSHRDVCSSVRSNISPLVYVVMHAAAVTQTAAAVVTSRG